MKKVLLILPLMGVLASSAFAQSSVTIYGIMDMGVAIESGNTAGSVMRLGSGIQSGSRLGFKGVEELGGGLSAKFLLEQGILADTGALGQGGLAFGRQAWVGLSGNFGSVTMGRQWSSHFLALDDADPFDYGLAGAASNLVSGPFRINNSIKYASPSIYGFSGEIMYGLGEVAGNLSGNRQIGFSVGYSSKIDTIRLAYNNANNPAGTDGLKNLAITAVHDFGAAKVHFIYGSNKNNVTVNNTDLLLGVSVPFGDSNFMASYIRKDDKTVANADANQFALGYTYALSKRTNVYTSYARISNNKGANYTVGDATDAGSGNKTLNVGIRHKF